MSNTTFVLKDQDGNYVSSMSIYFYEETSRVVYSFSRFLTNGFFSHPTKKMAEVELAKLQALENRFQLGKQFRIEEIDRYATLLEESKSELVKVGFSPFIREYKPFNDGKRYVWCIRDASGNFANAHSIFQPGADTWMYVSFKSFSSECRAYISKFQAEKASDKLNDIKSSAGFDVNFHLEYLDMWELIKEHKSFQGDNMVICEKVLNCGKLAFAK